MVFFLLLYYGLPCTLHEREHCHPTDCNTKLQRLQNWISLIICSFTLNITAYWTKAVAIQSFTPSVTIKGLLLYSEMPLRQAILIILLQMCTVHCFLSCYCMHSYTVVCYWCYLISSASVVIYLLLFFFSFKFNNLICIHFVYFTMVL